MPVSGRIYCTVQYRLDRAMNQQIGVTSDRGCEMSIGFVGKSKMADVIGAINRLAQGSQHHRLQQLRIGPVLDFGQRSGVILGAGLVSPAQLHTELLEKIA